MDYKAYTDCIETMPLKEKSNSQLKMWQAESAERLADNNQSQPAR